MSSKTPLADRGKETRTALRPGPAWLLCQVCAHRITEAVSAVSFDGAHRHAFSNPAGLTFTIGVFDQAPGCVHEGEATEGVVAQRRAGKVAVAGHLANLVGNTTQHLRHMRAIMDTAGSQVDSHELFASSSTPRCSFLQVRRRPFPIP